MDLEEGPVRYKRWEDVPTGLMSKTALREKGLKPGPLIRGTIFMKRRNLWVNLYDETEALPRSATSQKQLAALEKARAANEAARTCPSCKQIFNVFLRGSLCEFCVFEEWLSEESESARERFRFWLANQEQFAILDIETTGLDDAEIVEIAVLGLNEELLYHSLVRPERAIPPEATAIHGITDEMVADAPSWDYVWSEARLVLAEKTALIFNKAFDLGMIYSACRRYGLETGMIKGECVMEAYARYARSYSHKHRDFTWIGLQNAVTMEGISNYVPHRADGDGRLTARLIQKIGMD